MNIRTLAAALVVFSAVLATAADRQIPAPLLEWKDWALWDAQAQSGPRPFNDGNIRLHAWPSALALEAGRAGGNFTFRVRVFHECWIALPGDRELWPQDVQVGGQPVTVISDDQRPRVWLTAGDWEISGNFQWEEMPQRIAVPTSIGILTLAVEGQPVEIPDWDAAGYVWLKRIKSEEADRDFVAAQVYRLIEDGLPIWFRTEIELSVTGRSREEDLGTVLPEGWRLAVVEAPIPTAVDENGRMKAQVRAGKWKIRLAAYRVDPEPVLRFAKDAHPIVESELVALKTAPGLRVVEVQGLPAVDVSQTSFPQQWREFPVYAWETDEEFQLVEKMRGMGLQRPAGLRIEKSLWLDEDGRNFTWKDGVSGEAQRIWRLDVAEGRDLGAVKINGENQLITLAPGTGAKGVEIRKRDLDLEAVGRAPFREAMPATGWNADAESLQGTLHLPPGWRLFALFGAEWVAGDWLTAWSLLDLFLLLVFSMAIGRVWGIGAGMVAFAGFVLAYHEPGAPRFSWLLLLVPLLLMRVAPAGRFRTALKVWAFAALALLTLVMAPFLTGQIQSVLYPQLEKSGPSLLGRISRMGSSAEFALSYSERPDAVVKQRAQAKLKSNLLYEAQARIQTGPAVPEWTWRSVRFGWKGPVSSAQTFHAVLIPPLVERFLTISRVVLLLALAWVLLRRWVTPPPLPSVKAAALLLALAFSSNTTTAAEVPDAETLSLLRERLLQTDIPFPNAAEIPAATVSIQNRRIIIETEIHATAELAVPLPGKLPSWTPLSVRIDDQPASAVLRKDDYLWVAVEPGVHRVRVEGLMPAAPEWELTFLLKPRTVQVAAPDWTVTGLRPNGIPEAQIFFALKDRSGAREAAYDRKDFNAIVEVRRYVELGLEWQIRTEVQRLSPKGKAVSINVPLLPGERVLTANLTPEQGRVDVRLGANEDSVSWQSELSRQDTLTLAAEKSDRWVESWHLVASPVWNVAIAGIEPVFQTNADALVPVWHPWPGETATLTISRPEPLAGETITIRKVALRNELGSQHRAGRLELDVTASLGDDFPITLPGAAEITELQLDNKPVPVRKEGANIIVPVRPGEQKIAIGWQTLRPLEVRTTVDTVTLPVDSSNITTHLRVPENRWVLWTFGPLRGPAVRFWPVLIFAILAAMILGRIPLSPLRRWEWALLALGLTQVGIAAALFLVAWLFLLAWRGKHGAEKLPTAAFDLLQIGLVLAAVPVLGILLAILNVGLLGSPEMFILGNGSSHAQLAWFDARADKTLPRPGVISVSIWFYRALMLAWALWLASAFMRWAPWGWRQFSAGSLWKKSKASAPTTT